MFSFISSRTTVNYKSHSLVWQPNCTSLVQKHQVAEAIHRHSHPRSKEADIYFQLEILPYNRKPLWSSHKRDNSASTEDFFTVETWSHMVAKRIPVAFMAYNRGSPLISHWNLYWWVYCKWHSSSSTTRPSSPDQSIGFQQFAKASMHYSLCLQICTASPEESQPTRSNYSYGIWSCHDRMGEGLSICCLSCWSRQPLLKVMTLYNFGTSTSPFPWWQWSSRLWREDTQCTFKWQHQISSAATKQRPLHRSSNSLHPCQAASCRFQLNTHRPASKLLGSFWLTCQNFD